MEKRQGIALGLGAASVAILAVVFSKRAEAAPPPEEPEEPGPGLANLYGRVTSQKSGKVLAGASVTLGQWVIYTDTNGDYLFFEVEPGEYTLNVTKEGYEGVSLDVELVEGNNGLDIQLVPSTAEEPEEPEGNIEIPSIDVSPTTLTAAIHEYTTGMGIGHWGDPFNIGITFENPLGTDIWVRPDYAFGKLNGSPLEVVGEEQVNGFDAKSLIYFRLLLTGEYAQGDYSMTKKWQNPWNAKGQNTMSNMVLGIYDPDDVPRTIGAADYWLKIPPGGTVTATKEAHLGIMGKAYKCTECGEVFGSVSEIRTHVEDAHGADTSWWSWYYTYVEEVNLPPGGYPAIFGLCVAVWRAYYFIYDPGYGQQRVGSKWVTVNWRPVELTPVAVAIPDLIEIVPA